MDSEYVVEVEVSGIEDGNDPKLGAFSDIPGIEPLDALVREDGTGILYFRWAPPTETSDDGIGAATWMAAKGYTEHVLSAVKGIGFPVVEHRIVTRAVEN